MNFKIFASKIGGQFASESGGQFNRYLHHELEIIVIYGKNPDNKTKSLSDEDLKFFKSFPNIQIRYEKRLHAKFFANESFLK